MTELCHWLPCLTDHLNLFDPWLAMGCPMEQLCRHISGAGWDDGQLAARWSLLDQIMSLSMSRITIIMYNGVLSLIALFDRPLESLWVMVGDMQSDGATILTYECCRVTCWPIGSSLDWIMPLSMSHFNFIMHNGVLSRVCLLYWWVPPDTRNRCRYAHRPLPRDIDHLISYQAIRGLY